MPGPTTFNTPLRIITFAGRHAGKLGQDTEPNSSQLANWFNQLNDLINHEQTRGLKLWLQEELIITAPVLTAGTALYSLGPTGNFLMTKPMRVIEAWFQDVSGSRRPLGPALSRDEYSRLSQIGQPGTITSYYVDKQRDSLDVYFWHPPNAQAALGQVHLVVQTQPGNMISLTETMTFPQEWFMYLQWALASELATGQPQAIINRCDGKKKEYREDLEGWDVEDGSTRFVPDSRNSTGGAFR